MRSILLASLLGIACGGRAVANTPKSTFDLVAVRIDKTTFQETRLGTIRFDANPPFNAKVVEGNALLPIVRDMNALDHVDSYGGSHIKRDENQYFRIMRFGWLKDTYGIRLRKPGKTKTTRKLDVIAFADG